MGWGQNWHRFLTEGQWTGPLAQAVELLRWPGLGPVSEAARPQPGMGTWVLDQTHRHPELGRACREVGHCCPEGEREGGRREEGERRKRFRGTNFSFQSPFLATSDSGSQTSASALMCSCTLGCCTCGSSSKLGVRR